MTDTATPPSVDDVLAGGSAAISFKDAPIGHAVTGTVLSKETTQQTDFDTGDPKFYKDGNPMWQVVVTLQTSERDSETDDGVRRLFVRNQMLTALRQELARRKCKLDEGGTLTVTLTGTEPASNPRFNDKKVYSVTYVPPSSTLTDSVLAADPLAAAVSNLPASPAPATPAGGNVITAAQAEVMRSNGIAIPPGVTVAG